MAKYLFNDAAPSQVDDKKFKRRSKAGLPKMNFHVFAVGRDSSSSPAGPDDEGMWRYIGGFTDINGLSVSTEIIEVRSGETNAKAIKSAGDNTYGDITLNRGYDSDGFMQFWSAQIQADDGRSDRYLLDLVIFKLTADETKIARCFLLKNAWISNYTPGDMDTTTSDPWVETCTLTVDAWAFGSPSVNKILDTDGNPIVNGDGDAIERIDPGRNLSINKLPTAEGYTLCADSFVGGYTIKTNGATKTYELRTPSSYFSEDYEE